MYIPAPPIQKKNTEKHSFYKLIKVQIYHLLISSCAVKFLSYIDGKKL